MLASKARQMLDVFDAARVDAESALAELSGAFDVSDWQEICVGDVAKVVGGGTPPSREESNFGGDIPWVTPKDMTNHRGRYISAGARFLTREGLLNSSAKLLPKDAVLVSSRAPIGLVAIASSPLSTNQGVRSLIFDESQNPVFWYYLLRQSTAVLDAHANGSTFREISGGSLAKLKFTVPSLEWQGRIAQTLDRLDNLIEYNLGLNQVLGQLSAMGSHYAVRQSE
ncbi:restriction endonuclease subunit S [Curtobacterium sp. MCBD17_021]|uniref:restriction endonuclease subunit S n=1 Tax=Curtobacterium sp. MCBD17_021 TaxID=2175665 RepID=UPI0035C8D4B7